MTSTPCDSGCEEGRKVEEWTHQSRSTSSNASNLSRRALCLYPPTESRKWETTMSDRTTGLEAHSVPRYTTPWISALPFSGLLHRTSLRKMMRVKICRETHSGRVHENIFSLDLTRSSLCQSFSSEDPQQSGFSSYSSVLLLFSPTLIFKGQESGIPA
jgi:hypothetical protein